ncbi:DNA-binding protein [Bradyrhizobium sp. NC92]|uniref:helix-turn-helix domain-containing transcriptional regulator n=1 Tax=Bradyrhizobium sp. (strain NC92) TaxID=55395 RepID=UPI0039069E2A
MSRPSNDEDLPASHALAARRRAEPGIRFSRASQDLQRDRTSKDFNVSEIATNTGLQRTSIYRAFGTERIPKFSTVLAVLTAMDLELRVAPRAGAETSRLSSQNPPSQ